MRTIGSAVLGVVVAVVGTGIHRAWSPWGLVLAMAIVLSSAAFVRGWAGRKQLISMAVGQAVTVVAMGSFGPGGDVLIAAQPVGYAWLAGVGLILVAALLPSGWFRETYGTAA